MADATERRTWAAEFELVEDDGMVLAYPVGLGGGTEGYDMRDAVEMAADWLTVMAQDYIERGKPLPDLPLGTEPARGGRMLAVCVCVPPAGATDGGE